MKQLIVLDRGLRTKTICIIDDVIPVADIVSPQKTTFEIVKNDNISISDFVILKDGNVTDYIGVVQDVENDYTTKLSVFPIINVTDNEFLLTSINGNVYNWIVTTLTNNFIDADDKFIKLPLTFENMTNNTTLNFQLDRYGNLFDALLQVFLKTGIYIDFDLVYTDGIVSSIKCIVKQSSDMNKYTLRFDNPLLLEKPKIEFSQAQSTNKIVYIPSTGNTAHKNVRIFYLLEDNTITETPTAVGRLNGVVQKIAEYADDDYDKLTQMASNELIGDAYSHQITIKILSNESFDFKLYDKVQFIDENRTYNTYVTRIENNKTNLNVILGVLRNTITDKIKALQKSTSTTTSSGGGSTAPSVIVEDTLTSTSIQNALSANQGRVLKELTDNAITQIAINDETGIFTIYKQNGSYTQLDTNIEKVVMNFTYDANTQELVLALEDNTQLRIPMSAFIDDYTGVDGNEITINVSNDNKISAIVKNGSIAEEKLSQEFKNKVDNKVDKITGKGLSTNDYTTDEKNKLAGIEAGANNYTLPMANSGTLGGIKASAKDFNTTQEVKIGSDGKLYSAYPLGTQGTVVTVNGHPQTNWEAETKLTSFKRLSPTSFEAAGLNGNGGLSNVVYGNGIYLIISNQYALTSKDLINWTATEIQGIVNRVYKNVIFGNGKFAFICQMPGLSGGSGVCVSNDGINWQIVKPLHYQTTFSGISYANNRFIISAINPDKILISTDGIEWFVYEISGNIWTSFTKVIYVDGKYYGISDTHFTNSNDNYLYTSTDCINWTHTEFIGGYIYSIVYGNGIFLVEASNKTIGGKLYYSSDGINWFDTGSSVVYQPNIFAYGYFIYRTYYSKDGIIWYNSGNFEYPSDNTLTYCNDRLLIPANDKLHINELVFANLPYVLCDEGKYDCNLMYDTGVYSIKNGKNTPHHTNSGAYGTLYVMSFKTPHGNDKPNFATQIYIPNNSGLTTTDTNFVYNQIFYRVSTENEWQDWKVLVSSKSDYQYDLDGVLNWIIHEDTAGNLIFER